MKLSKYALFWFVFALLNSCLLFTGTYFYKHHLIQSDKYSPLNISFQKILADEEEPFLTPSALTTMKYAFLTELATAPPNHLSYIYYMLGYISFKEGTYKESLTYLARGLDNLVDQPNLELEIYEYIAKCHLRLGNFLASEEAFNKAIAIGKKSRNQISPPYLVDLYIKRAKDFLSTSKDVTCALALCEQALTIATALEDPAYLSQIYYDVGIIYMQAQNYSQAMDLEIRALTLAEQENLQDLKLKARTQIALNLSLEKNYSLAIEEFRVLLNDSRINEDPKLFAFVLVHYSHCLLQNGDIEGASKVISPLLKHTQLLEEPLKTQLELWATITSAKIKISAHEAYTSIPLLKEGVSTRYKLKDNLYPLAHFDLLNTYGDAYYSLKDYKKALYYHHAALTLIKEKQIIDSQKASYFDIYLDYKALGNYKAANDYLEKFSLMNTHDSQEHILRSSAYLYNKFKLDHAERQVNVLNYKKLVSQNIILLLSYVIAIVIGIIFIIYKRNISIRKSNTILHQLSITDTLTKLYNRRGFYEQVTSLFHDFKAPEACCLIMIDIDYFKYYNDYYGHIAGDTALQSVAQVLSTVTSQYNGIASRYGGEEFCLCFKNNDPYLLVYIVETLRRTLAKCHIKHETSLVSDEVTLSIGCVYTTVTSSAHFDELFSFADEQLYLSKEEGRNRFNISKV